LVVEGVEGRLYKVAGLVVSTTKLVGVAVAVVVEVVAQQLGLERGAGEGGVVVEIISGLAGQRRTILALLGGAFADAKL
jgi:hypothetical protein